jgi:response regulator RpfG family c-di-GMP phosphodiesterase
MPPAAAAHARPRRPAEAAAQWGGKGAQVDPGHETTRIDAGGEQDGRSSRREGARRVGSRSPPAAGPGPGTPFEHPLGVEDPIPTRADAGVLFVDDEVKILKSLSRLLRSEPVRVHTASSAEKALEILEKEPIQVVVSDQRMPGRSGVDLLTQVRTSFPEAIRMMLTGYTEIEVAVEAINRGEIFRLITKPWNDDELRASIRQALRTYEMRAEIERLNRLARQQNSQLQEMNHTLELRVQERTQELGDKHKELRLAYVSTVKALAEAIEVKDPYTRGHSERVGVYASRIARELGCEAQFIERIYLAGLLHDVGKIGIPDAIIAKPGRLNVDEYAEIMKHPAIGARILEPVTFLADIVPCVRHHHEWYDGSDRGYPDRLAGTSIPYPSRIILVADTVEAMTSDRPYRKGLNMDVVIDEIHQFSGTQFDPTVADAFLEIAEREGEGFVERADKFDIEQYLADTTLR